MVYTIRVEDVKAENASPGEQKDRSAVAPEKQKERKNDDAEKKPIHWADGSLFVYDIRSGTGG